jgi:hypothetical protein
LEGNIVYVNGGAVIISSGGSCETCGLYNGCKTRTDTACNIISCPQWIPIPQYVGAVKSDGTQIHQCPCCGHRYWG